MLRLTCQPKGCKRKRADGCQGVNTAVNAVDNEIRQPTWILTLAVQDDGAELVEMLLVHMQRLDRMPCLHVGQNRPDITQTSHGMLTIPLQNQRVYGPFRGPCVDPTAHGRLMNCPIGPKDACSTRLGRLEAIAIPVRDNQTVEGGQLKDDVVVLIGSNSMQLERVQLTRVPEVPEIRIQCARDLDD